MFQPSREQARRFFITAWRKYRERRPLEPIEALAIEHILRHPEYHALLDDEAGSLNRDWLPELGESNPFLHLGLHLAISEQLLIDQPAGIVTRYQVLLTRLQDEHAAQHAVMECLAETLWQAQRSAQSPDGMAYLICLSEKAKAL